MIAIFSLAADLVANLRAGLRLALLRPGAVAYLRPGLDQAVALILLNLLLAFGLDLAEAVPGSTFNGYAIPDFTLGVAGILVAGYATSLMARDRGVGLRLTVACYSALPYFAFLAYGLRLAQDRLPPGTANWDDVIYGGYLLWLALTLTVLLYGLLRRRKRVTVAAIVLFAAFWGIPGYYYTWQSSFWPAPAAAAAETLPGDRIDSERVLFSQPDLVDDALDRLAPQRPGVTDMYLVAFGGDATEDVFMHEVNYVRELFNRRFDTEGRSLALVNNPRTVDEQPLATMTNLDAALMGIGRIMDPEEDIAVVFLTSHGTPDHQLSINFPPLPLDPMTPAGLKQALDEAGIRWRIVIVSACYSGGFLHALEDPYTLVITAAAADKTSFGCGTDREFTYFGEALFRDQLARSWSLTEAFRQAAAAIKHREQIEGLTPSEPQMYVGERMAGRLTEVEARLSSKLCAADPGLNCTSAPAPTRRGTLVVKNEQAAASE